MKKLMLIIAMLIVAIPTIAGAWNTSSFNIGFSGSNGYYGGGSAIAVGFSTSRGHGGPRHGYYGGGHRRYRGYGAGYFPGAPRGCRTYNHYRPYMSERRANWNAHSPSAMTREIYVSERVHYSGGRW